jgi:glycosyltransferase involved in cell wall biosynthesis
VPTVQSLRDFRLICIGMYLLRDGKICEDCVGRGLTAGVRHRCYRNSLIQSAIAARMVHHNRRRGTWAGDVDLFVALTSHGKRTFIRGGIPADRIAVKPNVVPDPGISGVEGKGAVFVGRLSPEKGLDTLLESWGSLGDLPLGIVGEGPLRADLERAAGERGLANVRFEGALPFQESLERVRKAALLVMPSEWYETFGRVIVEAFAVGRPVVASRLGAMEELVEHDRTGLLFEPGNARDLAEKVRWLLEHPERCAEMGRAARREYEERYRPELAFRELMDVYERAIRHHTERSGTLSR